MKKQISILSTTILCVTLFSCNTPSPSPEGSWLQCNTNQHVSIKKEGEGYNLDVFGEPRSIRLESKGDGVYSGGNGQLTLKYDKTAKRFFLTLRDGSTIKLCTPSEPPPLQ